jgi:hypothetical protein
MVRACLPKPWRRQGRPPGMGHYVENSYGQGMKSINKQEFPIKE